MAGEVRARMVESAGLLLARKGLQGTSFSEVLEAASAPRGSVYHHFPAGKDQLVDAALNLTGTRVHELLDRWAGQSAEQVTGNFLGMWREVLIRSKFTAGCAVLAVTVAADSSELLAHTGAVFRDWRLRLAELLVQGGLRDEDAGSFAAALVAGSEGAVVLCRAEQSLDPFELVVESLLTQVRVLADRD